MANEYTYKVIKSSWGILISIAADVVTGQSATSNGVALGSGVFLVDGTPATSLSKSNMELLAIGLRPLVAEIASTMTERPIQIVVAEVHYNDADFQPEGIAAAIHGWAIVQFGLREREIQTTFNREQNRYMFDLPGLGDP